MPSILPSLKTVLLALALLTACLFPSSLHAQTDSTAPAAAPAPAADAAAEPHRPHRRRTPRSARCSTRAVRDVSSRRRVDLPGLVHDRRLHDPAPEKARAAALIARIKEAFKAGNYQEAWNICKSNKCFLSSVLANGLERIGRSKDAVEFIVEETALREANDLKTNTTISP